MERIKPRLTKIAEIDKRYLGATNSRSLPTTGASIAPIANPIENVAAVVARSQPYSFRIAGKSKEKEVRTLTPIPIVIKTIATTAQP